MLPVSVLQGVVDSSFIQTYMVCIWKVLRNFTFGFRSIQTHGKKKADLKMTLEKIFKNKLLENIHSSTVHKETWSWLPPWSLCVKLFLVKVIRMTKDIRELPLSSSMEVAVLQLTLWPDNWPLWEKNSNYHMKESGLVKRTRGIPSGSEVSGQLESII